MFFWGAFTPGSTGDSSVVQTHNCSVILEQKKERKKETNKTTEMTRTRWSRVKLFHWRLWKQSPPTVVDVSRASGQLENQKKNDPGSRHLLFMSCPQSCTTTPEIVSNWLFVPEQREEHTVYATQVLYTDTSDRELCRKSRMSVFVSTSVSLKVFCPGESESPPLPPDDFGRC